MTACQLVEALLFLSSIQTLLGRYIGHIYAVGFDETHYYFRIGSPYDGALLRNVLPRFPGAAQRGTYLVMSPREREPTLSRYASLNAEDFLEPFKFLKTALDCSMVAFINKDPEPVYIGPGSAVIRSGGEELEAKVLSRGGWGQAVMDFLIRNWKHSSEYLYPVASCPDGFLLVGSTNIYAAVRFSDFAENNPKEDDELMARLRPCAPPVFSLYASAVLIASAFYVLGKPPLQISTAGVMLRQRPEIELPYIKFYSRDGATWAVSKELEI